MGIESLWMRSLTIAVCSTHQMCLEKTHKKQKNKKEKQQMETLAITPENYRSLKARYEAEAGQTHDPAKGNWEFTWTPPEPNAKPHKLIGRYAFYLLECMKNTLERTKQI